MILHTIGSGSSGNCYLLIGEKEILILEAGMPFKQLLSIVSFDLSKVVGCLISHEHGDHASKAKEYLSYGIECYSSIGTANALGEKRIKELIGVHQIGEFKVLAFATNHDSAEPVGFVIKHDECGSILFATDTYLLPYAFEGINHYMIECNYSLPILNENYMSGRIDRKRKDRTILSHMELNTCIETLKGNDLSKVENILLIHLSNDNSNEKEFVRLVEENTNCVTTAASKGVTIDLSIWR